MAAQTRVIFIVVLYSPARIAIHNSAQGKGQLLQVEC